MRTYISELKCSKCGTIETLNLKETGLWRPYIQINKKRYLCVSCIEIYKFWKQI